MKFQRLLYGAEILAQSGNPAIQGVQYDSRQVKPGEVFVAMRGESHDGNQFIDQAIARGAAAIVTDSTNEKPRQGVAWARVPQGRRALARLSANFYGRPAERLAVTGVTGTNGKSTTAFLVESILAAAGRQSTLIGTIEYHVAGKVLRAPHTTPEALELSQMLAQGLGNGATEAVMEVSSHALAQQRVFGLPFDVAVFTNLTCDHLDYHRSMDEYYAAKRILFEGCGTDPPRAAVINTDDELGADLVGFSRRRSSVVFTYGWNQGDFRADGVEVTPRGTRFDLVTPTLTIPIFSPLMGRVNVYNVLAAACAAMARGCAAEHISRGVTALNRVPGRFEPVDCKQPFTVVVDYAHTDDALRNLTTLARELVQQGGQKGRVITVFGCGGDRDRTKRPLMGAAAGKGSDLVVLTSDNPRSEEPSAIIEEVLPGLERSGAKFQTEPDRKTAIALAIHEARPGDIVLLAGKGHEKIQITREGAIPFDDVEVARQILSQAGYDCPISNAAAVKNA